MIICIVLIFIPIYLTEAICTKPSVPNGNVTCSSAADGSSTSIPTHLDTCTVTCNVGFTPLNELITCNINAGSGTFDGTLGCRGKRSNFHI